MAHPVSTARNFFNSTLDRLSVRVPSTMQIVAGAAIAAGVVASIRRPNRSSYALAGACLVTGGVYLYSKFNDLTPELSIVRSSNEEFHTEQVPSTERTSSDTSSCSGSTLVVRRSEQDPKLIAFRLNAWVQEVAEVGSQDAQVGSRHAEHLILNFLENNNQTHLNLSGLRLSSLPDIFHASPFTRLQSLDLARNDLPALPAQIGQLQALQTLGISWNRLTVLPIKIGQFRALRTLDVSHNRLTVLPAEIDQFRALRTLDLSHNRLTVLPFEIGRLQALQTLNVSENQLTELPTQIGRLQALQTLYVSRNRLTVLPPEIGQLQALWNLNLSANPTLTSLPIQILHLPHRATILLEGVNLSKAMRGQLKESYAAPRYQGPTIFFYCCKMDNDIEYLKEVATSLESIIPSPLIGLIQQYLNT